MLSDLGAEVIKIETPEGDLGRIPSVAPYQGLSGLFLTFNRNKQSVVINLKTDGGTQAVLRSGQDLRRGASTTSGPACSNGCRSIIRR